MSRTHDRQQTSRVIHSKVTLNKCPNIKSPSSPLLKDYRKTNIKPSEGQKESRVYLKKKLGDPTCDSIESWLLNKFPTNMWENNQEERDGIFTHQRQPFSFVSFVLLCCVTGSSIAKTDLKLETCLCLPSTETTELYHYSWFIASLFFFLLPSHYS